MAPELRATYPCAVLCCAQAGSIIVASPMPLVALVLDQVVTMCTPVPTAAVCGLLVGLIFFQLPLTLPGLQNRAVSSWAPGCARAAHDLPLHPYTPSCQALPTDADYRQATGQAAGVPHSKVPNERAHWCANRLTRGV